jgi:hypothetical protein
MILLTLSSAATRTAVRQRRSLTAASSAVIPSWATYDPAALGHEAVPYAVSNMVGGKWGTEGASNTVMTIPHPMDRDAPPLFTIPDTTQVQPYIDSLRKCPKTGLHNPLKNPERYVQYGEISRKVRSICEEKWAHLNFMCSRLCCCAFYDQIALIWAHLNFMCSRLCCCAFVFLAPFVFSVDSCPPRFRLGMHSCKLMLPSSLPNRSKPVSQNRMLRPWEK